MLKKQVKILDNYEINCNGVLNTITIILKDEESVPEYSITLSNVSETTKIILDKIKEEFVSQSNFSGGSAQNYEEHAIQDTFRREILGILERYFPKTDAETKSMLANYIISQNLGFGNLEVLLKDAFLEEIVVNNATEPVWVYHKKHGWLKTNIILGKEAKIRHYSTIIGREINKEITVLNPLMDASLKTGDRVNATLYPISTKGNTITIRKFAAEPWTLTDFLNQGTMDYDTVAFLWLAIENELSILVAGGTGSGKTSALNVLSCFFPPNQRIISIEDTRELTLPENLHWVPMETRLPNPEGKGGVSMLDLLVNSLRMRPDRIVVGEIRKKEEAEVLLESMHTGHSVYATMHANNAEEVEMRLTNPPIDIPKQMLASLNLALVQNRNRRTGKRRTFQIAEFDPQGNAIPFIQYDAQKDKIEQIAEPKFTFKTLKLNTGMTEKDIKKNLEEKKEILKAIVQKNIRNVNDLGVIMAKYYRGTLNMQQRASKPELSKTDVQQAAQPNESSKQAQSNSASTNTSKK